MITSAEIEKKYVEIKSTGIGETVRFYHGLGRKPIGVIFARVYGDVEYDVDQWTELEGFIRSYAPAGEKLKFWVL